jgi:hypothetical protein
VQATADSAELTASSAVTSRSPEQDWQSGFGGTLRQSTPPAQRCGGRHALLPAALGPRVEPCRGYSVAIAGRTLRQCGGFKADRCCLSSRQERWNGSPNQRLNAMPNLGLDPQVEVTDSATRSIDGWSRRGIGEPTRWHWTTKVICRGSEPKHERSPRAACQAYGALPQSQSKRCIERL